MICFSNNQWHYHNAYHNDIVYHISLSFSLSRSLFLSPYGLLTFFELPVEELVVGDGDDPRLFVQAQAALKYKSATN